MDLRLINEQKQDIGNVAVSDGLFDRQYNEALVHQVVTSYLSNARTGTRAQKGRSEIKCSGRKPWRQKGSGRARAGRASSPIWRGGGKAFPSSPDENFAKKLNKKMYRAGMCVILSQLVRDQRLSVIDSISLNSHKTKDLSKKLKNLGYEDVLLLTHEFDQNLYLSSRNLPKTLAMDVSQIDPYSLLKFKHVLITSDGIKRLEEQFS
ncbi:MAG: 50S ribosomal protein L4 [Burkholderiales bacterium]|uniref:50S ribosomal protein L4 n=1 Tax=Nitrosomonas sp. TaxID=42353 RepID=UPI001D34C66E|nr:50S ribosomal protein L4 [Nitrosomonas sp.]MCB1949721.1 50S ribosomal protein L4 [Nitrosomonas sp.]MCP5242133.1 50S ribosomal protein L4 [Burkholderiales bacterium]